MKVSTLLIPLLSLLWSATYAQQVVEVELPGIRFATVDRAGDLYVVSQHGIQRIDSTGRTVGSVQTKAIDLFDTGNGVRMLAFYRGEKTLRFLNPTLEVVDSLKLDNSMAIDPILACSHGDFGTVLLDGADYSIKVMDTRTHVILAEYNLTTRPVNPRYMRSYQNFLFILTDQGIEVFNLLGKHLKTFEINPAPLSFNFLGEELYYLENNELHFTDLYTLEERKIEVDTTQTDAILVTDNRVFFIQENAIRILPKSSLR